MGYTLVENHLCPPALAFQRAGPIFSQAGPFSDEAALALGVDLRQTSGCREESSGLTSWRQISELPGGCADPRLWTLSCVLSSSFSDYPLRQVLSPALVSGSY